MSKETAHGRQRKFVQAWLQDPELCEWLVEYPKGSAFCKACNKEVKKNCGRSELVRHAKSLKHCEKAIHVRMEICRICFKENDEKFMPSIYDTDEVTNFKIYEKLNICGGIRIPLNSIPHKICNNCLDRLNESYAFRSLCRRSANRFENLIDPNERKSPALCVPTTNTFVKSEKGQQMDTDPFEKFCASESTKVQHETVLILNEPISDDDSREIDDYHEEGTNDDDIETQNDVKSKETEEIVTPDAINKENEEIPIPDVKKSEWKVVRPESDPTKSNKTFICHVCGNIYDKNFKLKGHFIRQHQTEKPYKCEICSKTFGGSGDLKNHMRVHTGERPFACCYCDRRFSDRSSKIRHERSHRNEKLYECDECGKKFGYACTLSKHLKIHAGIKPFVCLPCGKCFSEAHHLQTHLKALTHQKAVDKEASSSLLVYIDS